MRIGLAVGEIRGTTTVHGIVEQVRAAAEAGFPVAWSSQALGIDALTSVAVAGAAVPDQPDWQSHYGYCEDSD